MNVDVPGLVDAVAAHAPLVVALIGVSSLLEAGLGLGAVVPGETLVVLGATVLADAGLAWVLTGVLVVALGASTGDHLGWWIGRKAGPPLRHSRLVANMGVDNWDKAMGFVDKQGVLPLVLARQLPGVRTLVSAACGAAHIPYRRFFTASVLGSLLWSIVWTGGGALFGPLVIDVLGPILPWLIGAWLLLLVGFVIYKRVKKRRAAKRSRSILRVRAHQEPRPQEPA